jgi:hypothetical protein
MLQLHLVTDHLALMKNDEDDEANGKNQHANSTKIKYHRELTGAVINLQQKHEYIGRGVYNGL